MFALFVVPVIALALILAITLHDVFSQRKPRPMLEQIEEARWNQQRHEMNEAVIASYPLQIGE